MELSMPWLDSYADFLADAYNFISYVIRDIP